MSGGLVLALMAIPTIFQVAEVTLSSIPNSYKEGGYGLGATKWQVIYSVILPAALPWNNYWCYFSYDKSYF